MEVDKRNPSVLCETLVCMIITIVKVGHSAGGSSEYFDAATANRGRHRKEPLFL